jgi:hypothetical protein
VPKEMSENLADQGASGGALGGCSKADLKRGYKKVSSDEDILYGPDPEGIGPFDDGGFAGRPRGWER